MSALVDLEGQHLELPVISALEQETWAVHVHGATGKHNKQINGKRDTKKSTQNVMTVGLPSQI